MLFSESDTVDVNSLLSALLSAVLQRPESQFQGQAGGYPDEMFEPPLPDNERQMFECGIW